MSGHKARKRFGQNFLHDPHVIRKITSSIAATANDHVVEIGPGQGALTDILVETAGKLSAVELDRDLIPLLKARLGTRDNFEIIEADALKFDFHELVNSDRRQKLRVVGNLPYNISTPLLFHLIDSIEIIEDMHFMLQKELVDRICAKENENNYGKLSVMVQYWCDAEKLFDVGPGAFKPAPRVDSAIIRLKPHASAPFGGTDTELLNKVVTAAFSQRRKTVRNTLKKTASIEDIEACGIDPSSRAETISLQSYIELTEKIKESAQ